MKVGVWGAGEVGLQAVYRLSTAPFVSELFWINRTHDNIASRCVDIDHGLALVPCCHSITPCSQESAPSVLPRIDLLVLTLGVPVPGGGSRAGLYPANARMFEQTIVPALEKFEGIVLVVTNPVDLIARLVALKTPLPPQKVIGLGTVVETARMRHSLSSFLAAKPPARELYAAYAVGTHDEHFVPVIPDRICGEEIPDEIRDDIQQEVAGAARRVKADGKSTLHPVVEGIVAVAEAVAGDTHSVLTVSTMDPDDKDQLFYSTSCQVGREGIIHRQKNSALSDLVRASLKKGLDAMRTQLATV